MSRLPPEPHPISGYGFREGSDRIQTHYTLGLFMAGTLLYGTPSLQQVVKNRGGSEKRVQHLPLIFK